MFNAIIKLSSVLLEPNPDKRTSSGKILEYMQYNTTVDKKRTPSTFQIPEKCSITIPNALLKFYTFAKEFEMETNIYYHSMYLWFTYTFTCSPSGDDELRLRLWLLPLRQAGRG